MMREAFSKVFWGYLFILIEIHFLVIDVLPEPLGYYLIYAGATALIETYPSGQKVRNSALGLTFFSIPAVFIEQQASQVSSISGVISGWGVYDVILSILHIMLIYYLFQWMKTIVRDKGKTEMIGRTINMERIILFMLVGIEVVRPFAMNVSSETFTLPVVVAIIVSIIIQISFLALLRRFMKLDDGGDASYSSD
ncbi:hypothetical protein [Aquibacillus sediminis]|uniref:hypothetical protein n=1 Tax=Aquibacillus sediminis TaxID=2574734 RepID=UPI00110803CB|nr:hypothetical protein [Aquibacillus sediminis]